MILNTKSGGIQAKILQRQANLSATHKPGPPPEQDIPLNIPKKTKLFIDLATRERDNAARKYILIYISQMLQRCTCNSKKI